MILVYYNELLNDSKTKLLQELEASGMLARLYKHGIISHKPKFIIEARLKVADLMSQGIGKRKACQMVSNYIGVTTNTIYTYLR